MPSTPPTLHPTHGPVGARVQPLAQQNGGNALLTPPTTPEKQTDRKPPAQDATAKVDGLEAEIAEGLSLSNPNEEYKINVPEMPQQPREYTKKYQILNELGHGIWSVVYSATEALEPQAPSAATKLPPTPPVSPSTTSQVSLEQQKPKEILAIKSPSRRDAHKHLQKEARILTYLSKFPAFNNHIVPFHGFDVLQNSLVLSAIPMTLDTYIKSATTNTPFSTKMMFTPIIGAQTWATMTNSLLSGLAFLHTHRCIHGDIKPANILLQNTTDTQGAEQLVPLYCDFSSSHILPPSSSPLDPEIEEVTAVTADYTAPELLAALHARGSGPTRAVATFASDVFGLAVTLLFAATGESPYSSGRIDLQRVGMAREGRPVEFARSGEQGSRIPSEGVVDRVLRGGVEGVGKRLQVGEWGQEVGEILQGWSEGEEV